mmetsp:Transcript_4475/g.10796  ORF Transcript_4475/g.10796 Transcript_4475/m.10796 type:complete len:205 (-) Transcript_4475:2381-2995(-)
MIKPERPLQLPVLGHCPLLRIEANAIGAIVHNGTQYSQSIVDLRGSDSQQCQQTEFFRRISFCACLSVQVNELLPVVYFGQMATDSGIGCCASGISIKDFEDFYGIASSSVGHHGCQSRYNSLSPLDQVVFAVFLQDCLKHIDRSGKIFCPSESQNRFRCHRISIAKVVNINGIRCISIVLCPKRLCIQALREDTLFYPTNKVE